MMNKKRGKVESIQDVSLFCIKPWLMLLVLTQMLPQLMLFN